MRFGLQDIKKSVQRRGRELTLSLHFLRPGEYSVGIERLIAYYESLLGQPQRSFSQDEARACVEEYRLASCLMATLSSWYTWQALNWQDVVAQRSANAELLNASPTQLRLQLYTYVNEHYFGYLPIAQKQEALTDFAAQYELSVPDLEYLLALDSESEAILSRTSAQAPNPEEVVALYNQWAFEAALFHSSNVRFTIDYNAFARLQEGDAASPLEMTTGIGAVVKRLCYLARRLGVYYDLEYLPSSASASSSAVPSHLLLTLYGPQDVTGTPQQYGFRLARLCRLLLRYSKKNTVSPGEPTSQKRSKKHPALSPALLEAEATVHFLQRSYRFTLHSELLQLLPLAPQQEEKQASEKSDATLFDSSIEQAFADAFYGSSSQQGVDGWRLEREPEPLLLSQSIFIPDFALTREQRRIYVEILGFWTPAYRERKVQKLQELRARQDLLLAIPEDARSAFASIADDFPIVYYKGQLSVTDVLNVVRARYDDFAQRLALLDLHAIRSSICSTGFLAEQKGYEVLHCYRRSEIQRVAELVCAHREGEGDDEEIIFVAGLGFYTQQWLQQLALQFTDWLKGQASVPLSAALMQLRQCNSVLSMCSDATLTSLIEQCPQVRVQRDSIFDVHVYLLQSPSDHLQPVASQSLTAQEEQEIVYELSPDAAVAKKQVRERRSSARKRSSQQPQAVQENLWL